MSGNPDIEELSVNLLSKIEKKLEVLRGLNLSRVSLRKIYEIYIEERVRDLFPTISARHALCLKEVTLGLLEKKSARLDGQRNCYKEGKSVILDGRRNCYKEIKSEILQDERCYKEWSKWGGVGASALLRREPRIKLPGSELNSTVCEYFKNALEIASEDIKILNLRQDLIEEFREDLKKLEKFGRSRVIPLFIIDSAILDTILEEETECINEIKSLKEKMSRHIKKLLKTPLFGGYKKKRKVRRKWKM